MRGSAIKTFIGIACLAVFAAAGLLATGAFAQTTPEVITGSPEVSATGATLKGSVNPHGVATSCYFEFGASSAYGQSVACSPNPGSGETAVQVSAVIGGLDPTVVYHYRLVASYGTSKVVGEDQSFGLPVQVDVGDSCPNAAYRTGLSALLPDCRAYEMVSPVDKNGADVVSDEYKDFTAAAPGGKVVFATRTSLPGSHGTGWGGYVTYMSSRGQASWRSVDLTPTPALNQELQWGTGLQVFDYSEDFNRAVVWGYELPDVIGALPEAENLYLESTETGQPFEALTVSHNQGNEGEFPVTGHQLVLGGSSQDLGVVTFETHENLLPEAKDTNFKAYAADHGSLKLVGFLPGGIVPSGGSELVRAEQNGNYSPHAIFSKETVSRDGSRIFFYSPAESSEHQLYMRRDGTTSVLLSESETGTPTIAQGVYFEAATPDGKKAVFSTTSRLTNSDPGGPGWALYLYTDGPDPQSEQNLTFIARIVRSSPDHFDGETVRAISQNGSHIYFASFPLKGLPSKTGSSALYLWDNGQIRQVAPEAGLNGSRFDEQRMPFLHHGEGDARISADGSVLVFMSSSQLTLHYPVSLDGVSGEDEKVELYRYDASSNSLACVSCPQKGVEARDGVELEVHGTAPVGVEYRQISAEPRFFSGNSPYVFFNTSEALVPRDTNGVADAYEYNSNTGEVSLLSSGMGEDGTWFVDASADGRDVFLATRQKLSPWDPDKLVDLYDARAGGGLPGPPAAKPPCVGDACQGIPSAAPSFNVASAFSGVGNVSVAGSTRTRRKTLTAAQKLRRALAACARRRASRRHRCDAAAHRRYGVHSKKAKPVGRSFRLARKG